MNESAPPPLRREIVVRAPVETAFLLFTAHLSAWWPVASHSVLGAGASVAFEDGRIVERLGTRSCVWGTVDAWEPPNRIAFTWHPGRGPDDATEVAVSFEPRDGGTLVRLVHSGWERTPDAHARHAEYGDGWPVVLGRYADAILARPARTPSDPVPTPPERSRARGTTVEAGPPPAPAGNTRGTTDGSELGTVWFALMHRPGRAAAETGGSLVAHPLFAEHRAFLGRLHARGRLVAAGPFADEDGAGMTIVEVPASEADDVARLATEDDLSVAEGLLEVRVRPWRVVMVR